MRRLIPLALVSALMIASCSAEVEVSSSATTTTPPVSSTTSTITTTTGTPPTDDRRPLILDYSPTVSDIGALAFVATHPDIRLVAVTLPGTGESYCGPGVAHTRGVLEELGLGDVPVACGPDEPITGWNAFPTSWRVGASELDLPEAPPNEDGSAPQLLVDLIRASSEPIELLAVGPLTNLALAFEADPGLPELISGITIMGGAVDVPGNVFRNDVGEWNIWVDPTAAGLVFASGAPVTLIPLDATNHLPANRIFFEALDAAAAGTASELVRDLIAHDPFWLEGGFYFWDELAAAVIVDESIVELETRRLVVDDDQRENKGWTREDPAGSEVRVAVHADRLRFEQLYLDTLVGESTGLGYLDPTEEEIRYFEEVERIGREAGSEADVVITEVATDLGIDLESDSGFFDVLAVALPLVLTGPWSDRITTMEQMAVPESMANLHAAWTAALSEFRAAEEQLMEAVASGDFEAFGPWFEPVTEACLAIVEAATLRLVEVELDCF